MTEQPPSKDDNATLDINWPPDHASQNLDARIEEFRKRDKHIELTPHVGAVQFLRSVSSLATFVLPLFYMEQGSLRISEVGAPYWQTVRGVTVGHSSLLSMSLFCRSIFDDSNKPLTGKSFGKIGDDTLNRVAEHWTSKGALVEDATKALVFLRKVFRRCSQQQGVLLKPGSSLLERRIGLVKYHADRAAAHISLDPFLFGTADLVHVVAAITVIGAIIVDFDDPTRRDKNYFDLIDSGGMEAAEQTFQKLPIPRLFGHMEIHQQAKAYWKLEGDMGLHGLLEGLPSAIGWREGRDDA